MSITGKKGEKKGKQLSHNHLPAAASLNTQSGEGKRGEKRRKRGKKGMRGNRGKDGEWTKKDDGGKRKGETRGKEGKCI